jgi:hypothetical protein
MSDRNSHEPPQIGIYFSDFFAIDPTTIEEYGAFNVSLINDLPLFIDPFLLFDSENKKYQELHNEIIRYLRFLRDQSASGNVGPADIGQWFHFKEVKQNWLGFSKAGNGGSGLGGKFAVGLNQNLHHVFKDFGKESVTRGSHLEKVCLFADGVGRDHLSDFTTNLIKKFLLEYTQTFALKHLQPHQRRRINVGKVSFDYEKKRWTNGTFVLPFVRSDFVILTPRDMLTRDAAWINRQDLLGNVEDIAESVPDAHLRSQINSYFASKLGDDPSEADLKEAAAATVSRFPELIDYYIRRKEDTAEDAHKQSTKKVVDTQRQFIDQVRAFVSGHLAGSPFYTLGDSFSESLSRVNFLKHVIEDNDGWRLFYVGGVPVKQEVHLQLLYRLTWHATPLDVNREVNNGRGPVDYAVSRGSQDKTLVEFKLAKNSKLKANLQYQVATYETANATKQSITVVMHFNDSELERVQRMLRELNLVGAKNIVLIDAAPKQSASILKD